MGAPLLGSDDARAAPVAREARAGAYRKEALDHHAHRRDLGDALRLPRGYGAAAHALVCAVLALAGVYGSVARVRPVVHGSVVVVDAPAAVSGEASAVALFPWPGDAHPALRAEVRVGLGGSTDVAARVLRIEERPWSPREVRTSLGEDAADAAGVRGDQLVLRVAVPSPKGGEARVGHATMRLDARPLADVFRSRRGSGAR